MTTEELKSKWGGSLPAVGDWYQNWGGHGIVLPSMATWEHLALIIDPIPLTREVLGNIEEVEGVEENDAYLVGHGYFEYGDSLEPTKGPLPLSGLVQFKYLHQLQQLYRLLTGGKELTIEL